MFFMHATFLCRYIYIYMWDRKQNTAPVLFTREYRELYQQEIEVDEKHTTPNIISGDITMSSATVHMEPVSVHTYKRRRFYGYIPMGSRDHDSTAFLKTPQGKSFSVFSGADIDAPFVHVRIDTGYGLILYYPQYQNFIRSGKSNPAESVENIVQAIKWYGLGDKHYRWFSSCYITNVCFSGKLAHTMHNGLNNDARTEVYPKFSGVSVKAPYGDNSNYCNTNVWKTNKTFVCTGCKQPRHALQMMQLVNELNSTYACT